MCHPRSSPNVSPEWTSPREDIQRAVRIGLVEFDGTEVSISNEAFIDLGAAVARMGIPVSEILDEHEALTISVNGIAERLREVFQRYFWRLRDFVGLGVLAGGGVHVTRSPRAA